MPKGYSVRNQSGWKHSQDSKQKVSIAMEKRGGQFADKNPNWKGGITKFYLTIRESRRYTEWRNKRFQLDNWTCQVCGKRGGNLEVDHYPKTFKKILEENNIESYRESLECKILWDVNCGRTLCKKCHHKHTYKK